MVKNARRTSAKGVLCLALYICVLACSKKESDGLLTFVNRDRETPSFIADSAYMHIERQVNFGPRNPGSEAHRLTRNYLVETLKRYAGNQAVFVQAFTHVGYEGNKYGMSNIISSFNPEMEDRFMLLAHWDTRPRADQDSDERLRSEPIPGADDGGSGAGVLLELSRIFREHPPPIGIDIILFDGEDYGYEGDLDSYFLGSRYWSENPPVPGYRPRFGILLDMVGAEGAVFPREGFSMQYAPGLVEEIWAVAREKGYARYFSDVRGTDIMDDHWIINRNTDIPTINIIHHKPPEYRTQVIFPDHWHTHEDDMDVISTATLQAVGDVLVELIYNRIR
ncbi:MAG: M28 family peptidase [Balneolales bacterium]